MITTALIYWLFSDKSFNGTIAKQRQLHLKLKSRYLAYSALSVKCTLKAKSFQSHSKIRSLGPREAKDMNRIATITNLICCYYTTKTISLWYFFNFSIILSLWNEYVIDVTIPTHVIKYKPYCSRRINKSDCSIHSKGIICLSCIVKHA